MFLNSLTPISKLRTWAPQQHTQQLCWCSMLFFRWSTAGGSSMCTHHCVTFQQLGISETGSTDICSCFSYGSGSSDHTCRKLALTWLFFEKSPAESRKKTMEKDAGNCQCHAGPCAPTLNTWQVNFQGKQSSCCHPLCSCPAPTLLFPTQFDRGIKFSKI